jgi:hypothetical protein
MKMQLLRNPNPAFGEVATAIAKGPPPDWLVLGLEHFSAYIDAESPNLDHIITQMQSARDTLMRWLPAYEHLALGFPCPN